MYVCLGAQLSEPSRPIILTEEDDGVAGFEIIRKENETLYPQRLRNPSLNLRFNAQGTSLEDQNGDHREVRSEYPVWEDDVDDDDDEDEEVAEEASEAESQRQ